jgi:peptidoglycan hydrolase-like protein with peptidoglycan-binding domain
MAKPELAVGSFAEEVKDLHRKLIEHGLGIPPNEVDRAFFGPATRYAVLEWQRKHRLAVTGIVDERTSATLEAAPRSASFQSQGPGAVAPPSATLDTADEGIFGREIKQTFAVRTHEAHPMLPPDGSFLAALQPADIDGQPNLGEKEMLVAALQFYFGPAQWWNAVRKEMNDDNDLDKLYETLRTSGERYDILEQKTGLGDGYFAKEHETPGQVKLYAATDTRDNPDNPDGLPSYFLYEARNNLTLYVGPGRVRFKDHDLLRHVFNTLVLDHKGDRKHRPSQSHTLDFGFLDNGEYEPSDLNFFSDLPALGALRPNDIDGPPSKGEKEMLLSALRFYFGPAKKLKAVAKDIPDLGGLNALLRERYKMLETQTALPDGYFAQEHQTPGQVKLYAATDKLDDPNNPDRLPSYILHEAKNNLLFYVGPDFFHAQPARKVINTVKLDSRHLGSESHTLDFGNAMSL